MAEPVHTIDTQHGDTVVRFLQVAASIGRAPCRVSCLTPASAQHDAQFDYYGKRLATCSSDRSIKVYDVSGSEYKYLAELKGYVYVKQQRCRRFATWQRRPARYSGLVKPPQHKNTQSHHTSYLQS